ncbi:MAG: hypothetical protein JWQ40_4724 [Segetibacter sp.]|nr:hypothetical protein [Segetibacter sp.]
MKKYLYFYLSIVFMSYTSILFGQSKSSKEDAAVREAVTRFYDGWNAHDAGKMVSVYDDSVDHINAFAEWRTGRQTMKDELITFHAGPGKDSYKTITIEKVKFIKPDVVMAIVRQISKVGNLGMYILSKETGNWLIVSFANVPYTLKPTEAEGVEKKQN